MHGSCIELFPYVVQSRAQAYEVGIHEAEILPSPSLAPKVQHTSKLGYQRYEV